MKFMIYVLSTLSTSSTQTAAVLVVVPRAAGLVLLVSPLGRNLAAREKGLRLGQISSSYRGGNKGLFVLLSRTQAGPGRTVKQEQEEISRNHVQTFISPSVENLQNMSAIHYLLPSFFTQI